MKRDNKNKVWQTIYNNYREVWDDGVTIAVKPFSISQIVEKSGLSHNAVRFAFKQLIQARMISATHARCFANETSYIMN